MSHPIHPVSLAYRGVLIERPCFWCDTVNIHFDGLCQDGPCTVCGVDRRMNGYATHPRNADGTWSPRDEPAAWHDWQPHSYLPADVDLDLPAFEAIVDAARGLGWPERYTSDLFRDYQFIARDPDVKFVWVARQWGTHIIVPQTLGALGTWGYLKDNEPTAHVHYWNGWQLYQTTFEGVAGHLLGIKREVVA